MLQDTEIKQMLSRQIKKFIELQLGEVGPEQIAKAMREDFPEAEITRQWVRTQLLSPGWSFIFWFERRYRLNIEWLFKGEKDKNIRMQKL